MRTKKNQELQFVLSNLKDMEKEIFINNEHYNESGFETRKYVLELASKINSPGFFAEVGACMGTDTKLLEACGWTGILIEPSKGLAQYCRDTRNCIVENYALVSHEFYKSNKKISTQEINCFSINHILPNYPPNTYEFDAVPFSVLSKKHDIKKINIFILDVEGLEIEVMNGIDFEEVEIDNFIIECNFNNYSLEKLDEYMISKGYKNICLVEKLGKNHSDYHYKKM
jgi:FkbM family methyltransferase